jgi:hypothetical protein
MKELDISFVDESDPDFNRKNLIREIDEKVRVGHWKAAIRQLRKLSRRFAEPVPEETLIATLEVCMENRLHGARASEPARKILEQMVEAGYEIPEAAGNYCIKNCISLSELAKNSTHQGFGGLDTALAMMSALQLSMTPIQGETYEKIIAALAREGSLDRALELLRTLVVDSNETPTLPTFAAVASACVANFGAKQDEKVLTLLAYVKVAGYELDTIASTQDGREILACGVIAAERLGNDALGLRLLTAAGKAQGVAPDRGDAMVALHSNAAQRACTLIHKNAVIKAVDDGQWKLAVRILELMLERSLRPSTWIWRNVVTCCAKQEKSRKSTSLLLDWVKLSEERKADKPPISVFNTVVNVCEICDEQDLTLLVLDAMKKTHNTEGNLITFNIALKRLAKQANYVAIEAIIVGMLQEGVEPSVVSYTTAIASCVADSNNKQPALAYEWMQRMRARKVTPNVITYNTALAACLDGKLESTILASKIAAEMTKDVELQLVDDDDTVDEYTDVVPNAVTKMLARECMTQLKANWETGDIQKRVATDTLRPALLKLIDFSKSETAKEARKKYEELKRQKADEDAASATRNAEIDLEYSAVVSTHRTAEV